MELLLLIRQLLLLTKINLIEFNSFRFVFIFLFSCGCFVSPHTIFYVFSMSFSRTNIAQTIPRIVLKHFAPIIRTISKLIYFFYRSPCLKNLLGMHKYLFYLLLFFLFSSILLFDTRRKFTSVWNEVREETSTRAAAATRLFGTFIHSQLTVNARKHVSLGFTNKPAATCGNMLRGQTNRLAPANWRMSERAGNTENDKWRHCFFRQHNARHSASHVRRSGAKLSCMEVNLISHLAA